MKIGLIGSTRKLTRREASPELRCLLRAGDHLAAYPSRVPTFPFTPVEQLLQQLGHLDAALTAEADGCDAVALDTFGDYGIAAIRAALTVPVMGAGEAGLGEAARNGRRFAVVTVWPYSLNYIVEGLLREHGLEAQCTGIVNVGAERDLAALSGPDGYVSRIYDADHDIAEAVRQAATTAASRGADAVLFGCTCMSAIAVHVAAKCALPVINPMAAAVTRVSSLWSDQLPLRSSTLRAGRVDLIGRMVDSVAGEEIEGCPVCVGADAD